MTHLRSPFLALLFLAIAAGSAGAGGDDPVDQSLAGLGEQLAAHFQPAGELRVELLSGWNPPRGLPAGWRLEMAAPPAGGLATRMVVRCRLMVGDRSFGEVPLSLSARVLTEGWVAARPLPRGESLAAGALELRMVDLLRDREAIPADFVLADWLTSRPLPAGAVVSWRDVARRPLVRRGAAVDIVAADGPLEITLRGVALEDGARGEAVAVRNPSSRRDLTAFVVDENRVLVRF